MESRNTDSLLAPLGRLFFVGRSSRHDPARAAVIRAAEFQAGLKAAGRSKSPAARAARGRFLRLLGRLDEAAVELDAAAAAGDPAGLAYRWELASARARGAADDLARAAAAAPETAWIRAWNAVRLAGESRWDEASAEAASAAALDPRAVLPHFIAGLARLLGGDPSGALAPLTEGLRREPRTEWAHRARAVAQHRLGREEECLDDCFAAMRLNEMIGTLFIPLGLYPRNLSTRENVDAATRRIEARPGAFWAYVYRSDYRREPSLNENDGALEDLREALRLKPDCAWAWAYLARCQTAGGDFKGARESLEKAHALDPDCGWILAWRGEHRRRAGDAKGALADLERAVELDPDYELAYAWRGGARRSLGRVREAVADLDVSILLEPTYVEWCYFERMNAKRDLGRFGDALEDLAEAHRLNPKFVWETDPKKFPAALKELASVPARDPRRGLALAWTGDIHVRRRDFAAADAALTASLAADMTSAFARTLRGRARGELGRWKEATADFEAAVKLAPHSGVAKAWRGRAKLMRGDAEGAAKDLEAALESRTEKAAAWILAWKAEAELAAGRPADAEASASRALEVHARYADARRTRALSREALGRAAEALEDAERAAALAPADEAARALRDRLLAALETDDDAGLRRRAERFAREGRHEECVALYDRLLAARRGDPELLKRRAEGFRCLGLYERMVADLEEAARAAPRDAGARTQLGDARRHALDFAGALADARAALALQPESGYAWALKAEAERSLGRCAEAVESASRAAAAAPDWSWALIVRAKARRFAGDLEGAEADTQAAQKVSDDHYAHGWRAEILRKAGRLTEALADAEKAVALQPGIAWFRALKGEILRGLGRPDEGWTEFERAVRTDGHCSCAFDFLGAETPEAAADPSLAWVFAWRGGVARKEGRLDAARADLARAARLDPKAGWIAAWRGELDLHEGRADEGLAALDRALKLHPGLTPARVWRGRALLTLGRTADAARDFGTALKNDPDDVWALVGAAACLEARGAGSKARALFARAKALAPGLFEEAA
ncbi:MAG: tetratricopeptide repeat protein [Elusimicrobia bacterium]|nr:tetratricopeptide repeat protein [Elusimicrobiota bacterium]